SLNEYAMALLSMVMLHVLDEKWKDHLYDLDQLRAIIHYRSMGQTDPLIEYKHEAYTMFVDLMNDVYHTFTERFLRAQISFGGPQTDMGDQGGTPPDGNGPTSETPRQTRRFNEFGVLEDVPEIEED